MDGLSTPKQIANRCYDLGYKACALTDHGSISGAVEFVKQCKKKNIKHILGVEAYISTGLATDQSKESKNIHQVILARNLDGWHKLIQLVSRSNDPDVFYYKPRIDLDIMADICDENLISFSGHPGSTLYNILYRGDDPDPYINRMKNIFGENFFIEIQCIETSGENQKIIEELRNLAEYWNITPIATCDAHYATPDQSDDHKVLLCSSLKTTLQKVNQSIEDEQKIGLDSFFKLNKFHIPTPEELLKWGNTQAEIENTYIINERCENYNILGHPQLPKFKWTDGKTEEEFLLELCRKGWKKIAKPEWNKKVYGDRVKHELSVINESGLAGYFLIVQDYVNWAKNQDILVGPGRGSVGGSLVAYLLGITHIDPIKYNLIWERFYNQGRNTEDRVSLPDIDIDFPISRRKDVIHYIREKYGDNRVAQMTTFSKLMGRGALKEVLRVHSACDFTTMNEITKALPHEHEIADHLEETGEESIIQYVLKHDPKLIQDYCRLEEDKYIGDYGQYFAQAARIEGTIKSTGKHAAGVMIASTDLNISCPMVRDKNSDEKICGFDMYACEDIGLGIKADILGILMLDKLMGVNNLLQHGRIKI